VHAAATRWWLLPWMAIACASNCNNDHAAQAVPGATPAPMQPPRPGATELQAYLQGLATDPTLVASAELASRLQASAATWDATIIKPFTGCRLASEQALGATAASLWATLRATPTPTIEVRKHYAGDAALPPGAAHLRWALPVLFDSYVVAIDDKTVDLVFWAQRQVSGWRWYAMGNIDAALAHAISGGTTDPHLTRCAALVVASQHNERCLQLAAAGVLAALHNDRSATTHVCALAEVHCTEGR
jgi:hypothetical protein